MRFLSLNTPESVARTLHDGLLSGRIVLRRDLPRTRKKAMLSNLETGEMQPDSPLVDIARTQKRAILPNLETLKSRFQRLRLRCAVSCHVLLVAWRDFLGRSHRDDIQ